MSHPTIRRHFLKQSAATLGGLGLVSAVAGGAEPSSGGDDIPLIDTHLHLWDLSRFRLRWLDDELYRVLARDYLLEDFQKATRNLPGVQAIYMEVDVEPSQQVAEAEYVLKLCQQEDSPLVAAVIAGRPASEDFPAYLARFRDNPYIKGIREVLTEPRTPRGYCLDPNFQRGIRLLGELGLRFDLCVRSEELDDAAQLVAACPDTAFILDHCGNPDLQARDLTPWKNGLAAVARHENLVCKVSGFITTLPPQNWAPEDLAPVIDHAFDVFGPDRLMFASDWPVCTLTASYEQWVAAVRTVVRDHGERTLRPFFRDNATRIYQLG